MTWFVSKYEHCTVLDVNAHYSPFKETLTSYLPVLGSLIVFRLGEYMRRMIRKLFHELLCRNTIWATFWRSSSLLMPDDFSFRVSIKVIAKTMWDGLFSAPTRTVRIYFNLLMARTFEYVKTFCQKMWKPLLRFLSGTSTARHRNTAAHDRFTVFTNFF